MKDLQPAVFLGNLVADLPRTVGTSIINGNHLEVFEGLLERLVQARSYIFLFVVDGYDIFIYFVF